MHQTANNVYYISGVNPIIGLIQRVLLNTLTKTGGDELRHRVMDRAGVERDRQFRIDTNYSDTECLQLFAMAKEETGCSEDELFKLFATEFVSETRVIFPKFYEQCANSEDFLRRQAAIHSLIGSSVRDEKQKQAINDKFKIEDSSPGNLMVHYNSPNKLCGLYHALAHSVADSFGDKLTVRTVNCAKKNGKGTRCEFLVTWLRPVDTSTADQTVTDARNK